jgi:ferredoxin--NADP+ reductase
VAVIGAGNVSIDICRYLATLNQVEEIYAVVRRGPGEVKFSRPELENMVNLLDREDLAVEMKPLAPLMQSLGQNPNDFYTFIQGAQDRACQTDSRAKFRLRFLVSPTRMLGDSQGQMTGMEVEENTLVMENGEAKAISLGTRRVMDVDTVIFAIGDRVDDAFGLPVQGSEFVKNPAPLYPVEGISYETYDPLAKCPITGVFVSGWSRKASSGLVGVARKDGVNGARAVLQYLKTLPPLQTLGLDAIAQRLSLVSRPLIHQADLARLDEVERERAQQLGLTEFKFASNQEMLAAVGLLPAALSGSTASRR